MKIAIKESPRSIEEPGLCGFSAYFFLHLAFLNGLGCHQFNIRLDCFVSMMKFSTSSRLLQMSSEILIRECLQSKEPEFCFSCTVSRN